MDLAEPAILRERLQAVCEDRGLLGTVLVAGEGVNGSLAGAERDIAAVFDWLASELSLDQPIDARWTTAGDPPFRRMRVRLKPEIVTLGRPDLQPQHRTGRHVSPGEWNAILERGDALLIDTRNRYEIEVGTFPGAIDPGTASFREFPEFAQRLAREDRGRPLAMFCTGGIRCEKATALMLELGFTDVVQLQGGILNYLDTMAEGDNRWDGECFVFDTRVAVDRDLAEGGYVQCHACRRPLSAEDVTSPDYREGVSCPRCISTLGQGRATRLEERRRQVRLARERGTAHIGPGAVDGPKAGRG